MILSSPFIVLVNSTKSLLNRGTDPTPVIILMYIPSKIGLGGELNFKFPGAHSVTLISGNLKAPRKLPSDATENAPSLIFLLIPFLSPFISL